MNDQVWFTRKEAAEHLRVGTRTLDRWIADGKLPAYQKGRKLIRLRREDLDAFMMGTPKGGGTGGGRTDPR